MTPEAQRIAIAEACGQADRWVLLKRGLYWRPNADGYTHNLSEAWILTEAKADKYVYPHDEPVTKKRAPLPNYPNDLNAAVLFCDELSKRFDIAISKRNNGEWVVAVTEPLREHIAHNGSLSAAICEAGLRALNLWTDDQ